MVDFLLILGTGALSVFVLRDIMKVSELKSNNVVAVLSFSFVNFIFAYLIGRVVGLMPIVNSQYGTVLQMNLMFLGILFVIAILNSIVVSFIIKRLNISCECKKVKED